jgi:hypothetical protein
MAGAREQRYSRPGDGAIFVGQPFFAASLGLHLRWAGDGADRALLNELLSQLLVLELDHLATAAAAGQAYTVAALHELTQRPGWLLKSRLPEAPERYRLTQTARRQAGEGPRLELLLSLELATRVALASVQQQPPLPSWVARSKQAHSLLLQALRDQALFQPGQ